MIATPGPRYGAIAQILHWLIAALVLAMFGLGWTMTDLPLSQRKFDLYQLHKWLGLTIFALAVLRLGWRAGHPPPPLPPMPASQQLAARASHALLYGLLLAQPAIGFLQSNAANFPVVVWGVLPLPALIGADEALGETLVLVHRWTSRLLLALVLLHVAAALHHHLVRKDDVLRRMLPTLRGRG